MNKLFYPKLAAINIKKNGKFYFPYIITCIFTITMFYMMSFIAFNKGLSKMKGGDYIQVMMRLGCVIVGIFSVIFFFYTNSFLIKRRKKEIGLYNILGLEKKHIRKILFYETVYTAIITLTLGIICGIVCSRFSSLLLIKITKLHVTIGFGISEIGILLTIILFCGIFLLTLISNLISIMRAKAVELLSSGKTGEREPKTKWLIALIGAATLGSGYYIALSTKSPLKAFQLFFVAVVLVIIGTYALFTAGSIVILKMLRKKKSFYYQTKHFTSISGMIYRMKKNAVGLANVCILSTMVLVIISTTVCMYIGVDDSLNHNFPQDFDITYQYTDPEQSGKQEFKNEVAEIAKENDISISNFHMFESLTLYSKKSQNEYITHNIAQQYTMNAELFVLLSPTEYERLSGEKVQIAPNEVIVCDLSDKLPDKFIFFDKEYTVKQRLNKFKYDNSYDNYMMNVHYMIVSTDDEFRDINKKQIQEFGEQVNKIVFSYCFDSDGTDSQKIDMCEQLEEIENVDYVACRQEIRKEFYQMYGGLFYLGIFLGTLFLVITVLIIYYKQISEGYEDKERFEIMQKVGMSKAEVKKSIRSQVLSVFLLPIIVASVHIWGSFTMIRKLLKLLGLTNVSLFILCIICTIIVFVLFYVLVYYLTSKIYYKIVENK